MNKPLASAAVVCAAFSLGGCFGHIGSDGDSGPQASKDVQLTGFDEVEANGAIDLTITVGDKESIKIEGSEERVKNLTAKLDGKKLVLKEESSGIFGNSGKLHVTITVPALVALEINGSGDADVKGVKGDEFSVAVNGSGDVNVSGEAKSCSVVVNGSGDIDAHSLKAAKASVSVAGSGDIKVFASDDLSVTVAGSGDVTYFGGAKNITRSVTGSGDVEKG